MLIHSISLKREFSRQSRLHQQRIVAELVRLTVKLLDRKEAIRRLHALSLNEARKTVAIRGRLISFRAGNHRARMYPDFQFKEGSIRPYVAELLRAIPDSWAVLAFLVAPRETLKGRSHLELIIANSPDAESEVLNDLREYLS